MQQERTDNWHEYLMEAGGLGVFMISACIFTTVLEHPGSPVHQWIGSAFVRRTIIGAGMGLTAIGLIYSPWGKQSGAHLNPSVTVTFLRLGKLKRTDDFFYVLAQFIGAEAGVMVSSFLLRPWISHSAVNYAVTVPGAAGTAIAFAAEVSNFFSSDDRNSLRVQQKGGSRVHGIDGGNPGCDVHQPGVPTIRDEHESGPDPRFSDAVAHLERLVDLFHRAAARDARRRGTVPQGAGSEWSSLRQAAPPERQALHFSLRFSRRERVRCE